MRQLLFSFVVLACVLGALGGVGGVVWAAMIMGLVSAIVQDRARANLETENAALRAEIAKLRARDSVAPNKPAAALDRDRQAPRALPDGRAFLASLRQPPKGRT